MHAQWELKLARSLKNQRQKAPKRYRPRRDFMALAGLDYTNPEEFRESREGRHFDRYGHSLNS